jgi:hypothetical protein
MLARVGLRAERIPSEEALTGYVTRADGSLLGRPVGGIVLVHARVAPSPASPNSFGGGRSRHRSHRSGQGGPGALPRLAVQRPGPRWVRTAPGTAGLWWARAVTAGE